MQGILKTNTSVFRLEEGRRKGFKHQKVGAKNYSFDLYGKIKKTNSGVLRLVEARRRASNTQKART